MTTPDSEFADIQGLLRSGYGPLPMPARNPTDGFTLPQPNGISWRIDGLPTFITARGGAFLFLPGLRALRYFAGV
jgi:hypothetical protein